MYSKSQDEHMDHLRVVMQILKEHQLFDKYSKCHFWLRSVAFLGHIISTESAEVDPRKTKAVKYCPILLDPMDIRSF